MIDNVMGVEEAGKIWGLSPGYIKNLCADGKIIAKKIGRTWIIERNQGNPSKKNDVEAVEGFKFFRLRLYEFEKTDRSMKDVEFTLKKLEETYFSFLDEFLYHDGLDEQAKLKVLMDLRKEHKKAIDYIWQKAVLII